MTNMRTNIIKKPSINSIAIPTALGINILILSNKIDK